VDRLSGALEDGRLKVDEFDDRVGLASAWNAFNAVVVASKS
jgi:DUF1707 SHOCT-like domain